jgi:2-aminoadipate transaminase
LKFHVKPMTTVWTQARRAARMNPSIIREILKVTEKPGILSMAGGLPSADTFPVDALKAACDRVLTSAPREALQYAASEGYAPLREWVAARAATLGMKVTPEQVLITSGSQQGLDLVGNLPRRAAGLHAVRAAVRQPGQRPRRPAPRSHRGPAA